jgi:hypothetical protein
MAQWLNEAYPDLQTLKISIEKLSYFHIVSLFLKFALVY